MSITSHACAIDAESTAIATVVYRENQGYSIEECRTLRAGANEFSGRNSERAFRKLSSLLKKLAIESMSISLQPSRFFPLESHFSRTFSSSLFTAHCRAEASLLLKKPEQYLHDYLPYASLADDRSFSRYLLIFSPAELFQRTTVALRSCCSVNSISHYFKPMILSLAATMQPFRLLELEDNYLTFCAGSHGELEYFQYWQLNHPDDAGYFALREIASSPERRGYPVYITGSRSIDNALPDSIVASAGKKLTRFTVQELFSMKKNVRASCSSLLENKALCTALAELQAQLPS